MNDAATNLAVLVKADLHKRTHSARTIMGVGWA